MRVAERCRLAGRWSLAVLLAVAALAVVTGPAAAQEDDEVPDDRRVLVISLPGLTWQEVNEGPVPQLRRLLDRSAVASVSLRVRSMRTRPGEGYATLGAGTRAVASNTLARLNFGAEEPWGEGTAAEEVARQRGAPVDAAILSVVWRELEGQNERSDFDAEIGTLGEALEDAGIQRGVVANGDGSDILTGDPGVRREAVLAMADRLGGVPCGRVDRTLLQESPAAPFGVRLDQDEVLEAFRACSTPGSVVLVEASDLRRADVFGGRLGAARAEAVRERALRESDELVARLVAELDMERDAVVVLSPSVSDEPRLGVVGIRAVEYPPSLLESGSTRQPGYVTLADLTPTIAHLAGAPIDEGALEGRTVATAREGGTALERRLGLEEDDEVARFRDRMITPVVGAYVAAVCALAVAAVAILARQRRSRVLEAIALVLLAFVPVTYLARAFPFHEWGATAYWFFVVGGSAVLGAAYFALRRSWLVPLAVAYAVVVGVIFVNVAFLGSNLQLGAVFGDSAIVAGRFNGVNNVMFAQLVVAATALAAIAAAAFSGRARRVAVVAVLGGVAYLIGAPRWGADVGGTLAGVPALALVGSRLLGWRIRWRTVALWAAVAVVVVVVFGFIDMNRDSADQSHLGRLFERIESEGIDGFNTVVGRKLATNLRSVSGSVWRFILVPVILAAVLTVWRSPRRFDGLLASFPELRGVVPGLLCGLALGYALNDSGIAVPGMMLAVSVPAVVYLLSRSEAEDVPAVDVGLDGDGRTSRPHAPARRTGVTAGTGP